MRRQAGSIIRKNNKISNQQATEHKTSETCTFTFVLVEALGPLCSQNLKVIIVAVCHYGYYIKQIIRDIEISVESDIDSLALLILNYAKCSGCSNKRFGQENIHW